MCAIQRMSTRPPAMGASASAGLQPWEHLLLLVSSHGSICFCWPPAMGASASAGLQPWEHLLLLASSHGSICFCWSPAMGASASAGLQPWEHLLLLASSHGSICFCWPPAMGASASAGLQIVLLLRAAPASCHHGILIGELDTAYPHPLPPLCASEHA